MAYKSILTICTAEDPEDHIDRAVAFAESCGAHLHALCIAVDRTRPELYMTGTVGITLADTGFERALEEKAELEAAARDRLSGMHGSWSVESAAVPGVALTSVVSSRARFADLVVLPMPYGPGRMPEAPLAVEAALFGGQAPVLVLPDGAEAPVAPRRLLIAWNDSPEAMAAIRAGLPFIVAAETAEILVIDPPQHGPEATDPGAELAAMLARHGASVSVALVARTMPRVSDMLNREMSERGADMILLGAYSHSRFREAILGGTTRNLLETAKVPMLLAH